MDVTPHVWQYGILIGRALFFFFFLISKYAHLGQCIHFLFSWRRAMFSALLKTYVILNFVGHKPTKQIRL